MLEAVFVIVSSGERGAHPGGHSVARNVARGAGGGVAAVLRREERQRDVCRPGAPSRHDGERAANSERNLLQSGTREAALMASRLFLHVTLHMGFCLWRAFIAFLCGCRLTVEI